MTLQKIYWEEEVDARYRLSAAKRTIQQPISLHWHNFYELELVLSGQGEQLYNGTTYPLTRGCLYIMSPADTHSYLTSESPICLYHLSVNAERLSSTILSQLWADRKPIMVGEKDILRLSTLFELLIEECDRSDAQAETTEKHILELLFTITLRLLSENVSDSHNKTALHKAIAYMQANFTRPLPLAETAAVIGLNRTYFSSVFTKQMGRGYNQYLTNLRIEYAKRLLRGSMLSINEICYECGFSNISTFLQAFRKTTTITPTEYRKRHT